ncbi:uncharacterized protein LAJ45_08613 [Morchella importuna]|uniref:uncharacterized protein n=1 Tax=Morchella importuna TaxID=1174673 RepID=UPI001E8E2746|nr:uncharacterized protein LAJ45_08613 [Morchella importuna]KAH8147456.1 hypothetical protein LAJ45_08613 [Morchella importuna]
MLGAFLTPVSKPPNLALTLDTTPDTSGVAPRTKDRLSDTFHQRVYRRRVPPRIDKDPPSPPLQPQPDFLAMAADMNTVARAHASMAINLERMQNIPVFNQGAEILEAIRQGFKAVNSPFHAIDSRRHELERNQSALSNPSHLEWRKSSEERSDKRHDPALKLPRVEPLPLTPTPHTQGYRTINMSNRSLGRNVHIYDASDPTGPVLGGLILTNGVTNVNLYSMVDIILILSSIYHLQDAGGSQVDRDDHPLQPGNYYVVTDGSISINNEICLTRTISLGTGTLVASFRNAVRDRDRRCVITGEEAVNADLGEWGGFEAAHIFPLAYEHDWKYDRWITIDSTDGRSINSVQNGILLRSDIHVLFDRYNVSINPDDDYKIVCFLRDSKGIAGKHLDQRLRDDPRRPVDELLRWHFRQAVLANVRLVGEPIFEVDFPPGSDMIGEILSGPKAGERMEYELFSRLVGVT